MARDLGLCFPTSPGRAAKIVFCCRSSRSSSCSCGLRSAADAELRPLELSVAQYACLELLDQGDEFSNADLARGAFVTRQSMDLVLRGLEKRGLVTRPAMAPAGRARPAELTEAGHDLHPRASELVRAVAKQMLSRLCSEQEEALRSGLHACIGGPAGRDV